MPTIKTPTKLDMISQAATKITAAAGEITLLVGVTLIHTIQEMTNTKVEVLSTRAGKEITRMVTTSPIRVAIMGQIAGGITGVGEVVIGEEEGDEAEVEGGEGDVGVGEEVVVRTISSTCLITL